MINDSITVTFRNHCTLFINVFSSYTKLFSNYNKLDCDCDPALNAAGRGHKQQHGHRENKSCWLTKPVRLPHFTSLQTHYSPRQDLRSDLKSTAFVS